MCIRDRAGIPEAGLALIFAVDRPLDMCRTVVNITGDATVSTIVSKFQKTQSWVFVFLNLGRKF